MVVALVLMPWVASVGVVVDSELGPLAVPQTSLDNSVNFHRLMCAAMCAAFSAVGV